MKRGVVDWKEHPIEVMAWLDRLGGKTWTMDPKRWDITESVDLDRAIPDKFLPIAAAAMARAGLAIVTFESGGDDVVFAVVPKDKAKLPNGKVVAPGKVPAKKKKAAASKLEAEATKELAELQKRLGEVPVRDGAWVQEFQILYVARILLAAGREDEARTLFDLAVTNELDNLESILFRQHGPHFEAELLGAAILAGRGHELVRGWAHYFSLGERGDTRLWTTFLGRNIPGTWKRGNTVDLDALLKAYESKSESKFKAAAKDYLTKKWSSSSRGMKGNRASFLVSGLFGPLALGEALDGYILRLPAKPERPLEAAITGLPKYPAMPSKLGAPRDGTREQAEYLEDVRAYADWIADSLTHAVKEKSGLYLRAVPETAVDVARGLYAAGATVDDIRTWLSFAIDLEIARCTHRYAEDSLGWHDMLREVAGAAVLVDRGAELAKAWSARKPNNPYDQATLDVMTAWLAGKKAPSVTVKKRIPLAIVSLDPVSLAKTAGNWRNAPAGPFSPLVTALAKPLKEIPAAAGPATMSELIGGKAAAVATLEWPKPRTKLPLGDLRQIARAGIQRIETSTEPIRAARDCLLVARCVHALGASVKDTGAWLRRAVDIAKTGKHMDEDLVGAARLVKKTKELAKSIHDYTNKPGPERSFAEVLRAYAVNEPFEPDAVLKKRFFFFEFTSAAAAARAGDLEAMRAALGRAPWQHRQEWTAGDTRKRPPDLSWFVMGLCVDRGGLDGIPPSTLPFVDTELVEAALAGAL